MGFVYANQGRYAEAMECYGRQLAISEDLATATECHEPSATWELFTTSRGGMRRRWSAIAMRSMDIAQLVIALVPSSGLKGQGAAGGSSRA